MWTLGRARFLCNISSARVGDQTSEQFPLEAKCVAGQQKEALGPQQKL
jgi:hypothetical protein